MLKGHRGFSVCLGAVLAAGFVVGCDSKDEADALKAAALASARAEKAESKAKQLHKEVETLRASAQRPPPTEATAAPVPKAALPAVATAAAAASPEETRPATSAPVAPTVTEAKPGAYSLDVIRTAPMTCKTPSVMLAGVSNNVASKKDFAWTFAVQAMYAHPEFVLTNKASLTTSKRVAFQEVQVTPKVVGLVAHCLSVKTCNRLGAMFKTTVPTSKPEIFCGKEWGPGKIPRGLLSNHDLRTTASQKLKAEPTSMCARVGVCSKQQNPAIPGDPGAECQKTPGKHRYKCASKKSCKAVVECTKG